jgi:hypothetical protein
MDELQSSFKNEFNADKLLRKQMDKQYEVIRMERFCPEL